MWDFLYKSFLLRFYSIFLLPYNISTQYLQHFCASFPHSEILLIYVLWFSVSVSNFFIFSHLKYLFNFFFLFLSISSVLCKFYFNIYIYLYLYIFIIYIYYYYIFIYLYIYIYLSFKLEN